MLFMLGAKSAIVWTAAQRFDPDPRRHPPRQIEPGPIEPPLVGANEIVARAVLQAVFAKVNSSAANNDLRRHNGQTLGTGALRQAEKAVIMKSIVGHGSFFRRYSE
jgi:hypothetical protein